MGHHINEKKQFQSDLHPELPPNKIIVSFDHPQSWPALAALAEGYEDTDPELAEDIREVLREVRKQ